MFRKTLRLTAKSCVDHGVARSAAALAYYLLFAMFPLMIFVSNMLGMLDLNTASIASALRTVMPADVVQLLESYLNYVSEDSTHVLFWFSLVFTVWFPLRAVKGLMEAVRRAYRLGKPQKPVHYMVHYVLFTLVFLLIIILTLLLSTFGKRFLSGVVRWLGIDDVVRIPAFLLTAWQYLRFVLVAVIMFAVLGLLYALAQDSRRPVREILPGTAVALAAWLVISIGFSVYVENFGRYSVIYGTLGAVMVLLMWLYMTAMLLIIGAEFNAALCAVRKEYTEKKQSNAV